MNHFDFDFGLCVSERTELFVVASNIFIGIGFTEFGFVAARVVDLLDFVVGIVAQLVRTLVPRAEFVTVYFEVGPPTVGFVVIKDTSLALVVV